MVVSCNMLGGGSQIGLCVGGFRVLGTVGVRGPFRQVDKRVNGNKEVLF